MSKLKVLICHNSKSAASLLGKHLGSDKVYSVYYSFDIQSSLSSAFDFKPDLIIVGQDFDDGSTPDLIKKLKRAEVTELSLIHI